MNNRKKGGVHKPRPKPSPKPGPTPSPKPGPTNKIEHVVVLMMENRSFDHLFGFRTGVNGLKGNEFNLLDPTAPESDTNPAFSVSNGAPYAVLAGEGPGHSINATNVQLAHDKAGPSPTNPAMNNGFVQNYKTELVFADKVRNPSPEVLRVVMESFAPSRLPSLNALADAFCVCDNWYAEVPGPTQSNRLYLHAATSAGFAHNVWGRIFDVPTIYNHLQDAGFTWATYEFDHNEVREFSQVNQQAANFKQFAEAFAADVRAGTLANYSFIAPRFLNSASGPANSQHAPEDARYGDNFIADVYEALRSNEAVWAKSVLIVIYDEHGGFYDHIVPPSQGIPNPDGINSPPPADHASFAPTFAFDRLGLRVPAVIVSPWVKAGTIDTTRYQHTSVLATLKKMFGLPNFLTKRDAAANPFDHLFQELSAPRTDTPKQLPRVPLPPIAAATTDPSHPINQPLDTTQKEILLGVHHLTQSSDPKGLASYELPITQGEASRFIQERYRRHFGNPGKPGVKPGRPRRR